MTPQESFFFIYQLLNVIKFQNEADSQVQKFLVISKNKQSLQKIHKQILFQTIETINNITIFHDLHFKQLGSVTPSSTDSNQLLNLHECIYEI